MSEEISMMELSSREALSEMTVDDSMPNGNESTTATVKQASPPPNAPVEFPETAGLTVESEGSFIWHIKGYYTMAQSSQQQSPPQQQQPGTNKLYSEPFKVGSHSWKLLLYPRGNEPYEGQCLSLYVAMESPADTSEISNDWYCCAQVIMSIEHTSGSGPLISKYTQHRFDAAESDWGFGSFCTLKALTQGDPITTNGHPIISNDADDGSFTIKARIRIIKDRSGILWHNFINYNSKKVTGYVGLANQGATCYMNSLLQSLYFTNAFRKAIYMIPTKGDLPIDNSALALQRIFWRLQHDDHPTSTNELTKAFGWETLESFIQSDVQEFSRVLLDELESKMKGTQAEGTIERLFVGRVKNVIRCLNVPFESTRTEKFYDLQLSIKGVHTLEESFEAYVKAEMLEGDNRYAAEGYGLQDAKRFVEFEQLPPVLHLHLERYAFDPRVMATVKINDRLEFPLRINLNKYLATGSPQQGQDQTFVLSSVFVHSGDSHGGHYYVYMRDLTRRVPQEDEGFDDDDYRWYKFDDTKVIPATKREAVDDNFGGDDPIVASPTNSDVPQITTRSMGNKALSQRESKEAKYRKFTNAYMLVYIRESDLSTVLFPIDDDRDIPGHIGEAIRTEDEAERKRKADKQAALLTVKAHILTDEQLGAHGGFDFYNIDNRNWPLSEMITHRVPRTETLGEFKKVVANDLSIPVDQLRFWTFHPRRNKTVRLDEPISADDESKPISYFYNRLPSSSSVPTISSNHFVLYAERCLTGTTSPRDPLCIGFKFYDPEHGTLKFVGKYYVALTSTLDQLYPELREAVGLPKNVQLEFYEEIKPGRIDAVNSQKTFAENQLQTGDIICFQLASPIFTEYHILCRALSY